ncbi:MAG: DUF4249 domain-containing protein [Bacteroidales bacterium]|nr:DUF4249 domain-containing protein [Bacteroidales bacterium]
MKIEKIVIFIIILITLIFSGCQEEYFAKLDKVEPLLVVQGMITNQPGPYLISLSLSWRFQEPPVFNALSGAIVSISANDATNVNLVELSPGSYYTPAGFIGEVGKEYTLQILTPDGHKYTSSPQEILPPLNIDSIYGTKSEKVFYRPSSVSNTLFATNVPGAYAFINTSNSDNNSSRFRFASELYVQYGVPISDTAVDNCWIKKPITGFQPTDLGFFSNLDGASQEVGFVPLLSNGIPFLGFPPSLLYDQVRVIINKVLTLNEESYNFHKAKNDQLNSAGRILDPIAAQLPGNIQCISDPDKLTLGFFEACAETILTYRVITTLTQQTVDIIHLPAMNNIPNEGCLTNQYPPFWVN